jgi:hypothetical protein
MIVAKTRAELAAALEKLGAPQARYPRLSSGLPSEGTGAGGDGGQGARSPGGGSPPCQEPGGRRG